jgi:5'-nucleotidase
MSDRRTSLRRSTILCLPALLLACAHGRPEQAAASPPAEVRLLTLNDFHGQLVPGKKVSGRPVGSAGVLGAWLMAARAGAEQQTILVSAGDLVGASPPASALLQDEPSIAFLNRFAGPACRHAGADPLPGAEDLPAEADPRFASWLDPGCNVVGVIGNHELDEGRQELLRLLTGGNHPRGPFLENPWRGARWPVLAANVVDQATGRPFLPPYVVKEVDGVRVGFIGVVTSAVAHAVSPSGIAGLEIRDEAETVNRYAQELRQRGVRALVVVLHEGGEQPPYAGWTREGGAVEGPIVDLVARLDPEVDVVVAGHTHAFLDARLPAADGAKQILVVEAFSAGTAFGRVDLEIDRASGDVTSSRALVQTAWADEGPGQKPDRPAAELQRDAEARVAPMVKREVATLAVALGRHGDVAGESPLGNLVADAQRAAAPGAQVALTNPGGLRTDLRAGPVTWGDLFAAQPFGNDLVAMTLTGADLLALLEQQWRGGPEGTILQVSGLYYAWSESAPPGKRVREARVAGKPLDRAARYRVVVNGFLAGGGDGFDALARGTDRKGVGTDLEALVAYLRSLPQPVRAPEGGRIRALP